MQRITSATAADLFDIAATRRIEHAAAATLPSPTPATSWAAAPPLQPAEHAAGAEEIQRAGA